MVGLLQLDGVASREKVLAVVSYWSYSVPRDPSQVSSTVAHRARRGITKNPGVRLPATPGGAGENEQRVWALQKVLRTLAAWPLDVRIILVTNSRVPEADGLVVRQEIRPKPVCYGVWDDRCLAWEAIRVLTRGHRAGSGCVAGTWSANCSSVGGFDYYVYAEGDIEIPWSTFRFWRANVERLHRWGYFLHPHRREVRKGLEAGGGSDVLPDVWTSRLAQAIKPVLAIDWADSDGRLRDRDQIFLRVQVPHSGSALLTCRQFLEYLDGGRQWDFGCAENPHAFGIPELAASTLASHLRYWAYGSLTHVQLPVYHLLPRHSIYHRGADNRGQVKQNASILDWHMDRCSAAPGKNCLALWKREMPACPVEWVCQYFVAHRKVPDGFLSVVDNAGRNLIVCRFGDGRVYSVSDIHLARLEHMLMPQAPPCTFKDPVLRFGKASLGDMRSDMDASTNTSQ